MTSEEVQWGSEQVLSLISHVGEFFEEFYSGTKRKKVIWQEIAEKMQEEGYNFTGNDCDKKWRNLKVSCNLETKYSLSLSLSFFLSFFLSVSAEIFRDLFVSYSISLVFLLSLSENLMKSS